MMQVFSLKIEGDPNEVQAGNTDIFLVRDALKERFLSFRFTVTYDAVKGCDRIDAEFVPVGKKKRLSVSENNIVFSLIPGYAEAFYKGLCKGREKKVE